MPADPAMAPPPVAPPAAAPQPAARKRRAVPIAEQPDDVVALEGRVVAVPAPPLTTDVHIGLGAAQGVKAGEWFLAHNATVRTIAVLHVITVQDRSAMVEPVAQLAALQQGDRVKRISAARAAAIRRQLDALGTVSPPLDAPVVVDDETADIVASIGRPGTRRRPVAPVPVAAAGPDLSDVLLLARASDAGIEISWQQPARDPAAIAGYVVYRAQDPAEQGIRLTPTPVTGLSYEDRAAQPEIKYVYRLAALDTAGAQSAQAPSVEATWTAPKKGTFGIGGAPASVKAMNVPIFTLAPATAMPAVPMPAMPAMAPPPPMDAAPAAPPAPAATPPPPPPPAGGPPPPPAPAAAPPPPAADIPPPPPAPASTPAVPPPPPAPPAPSMPPLPTTPPVPAAPPPAPPAAPVPPSAGAAAPAPAAPSAEAGVPAAPEKVTATLEGSTVVVRWNPVGGRVPLAGYLVYRALPGDDTGAPLNGSPIGDTVYRDRTAKEGSTYTYWVVAQTVEGRQGTRSARQQVEVPKAGGVVPFF